MKRKLIFTIILVTILAPVCFIAYKTYKIQHIKWNAAAKIQRLPDLPFNYISEAKDYSKKPIVVNYFSPDCDHCQYMVKQLLLHKDSLKGVSIIMITPAKMSEARSFSTLYGLDSLGSFTIGCDSSGLFFKIFGSAMIPSFYIYNSQHKLVSIFHGEVKIESILNVIK